MRDRKTLLLNMYQAMLDALGPSRWWPGETPFEVAVGAILTQNTNWTNVEKAIAALRRDDLLDAARLFAAPTSEVSERIRPAGYFRLKADRLAHFLLFLRNECGFSLDALAEQDTDTLREKLLGVKGIGPETADSILLYSLGKPSFVVDAYTRRILHRHGQLPEDVDYAELRDYFMDVLPDDVALFNEYHALIVRTAKQWCRKREPLCEACPLGRFLE
ncbi:MAG: endonuclease III domain-containing protein [Desulfovibrionaceae bacterium]